MHLPFPGITKDDLAFLELDVFDTRLKDGDQLWQPKRLLFMFNVVASACCGSPDLTVAAWLRLIEGDHREDFMAFWVDGDETVPWGALGYGPHRAHWKAAQNSLRARYNRVSSKGYKPPFPEKTERIRSVKDGRLRAAAISWMILTSRPMEAADAERGLRTWFRFWELIKTWDSLPLSKGVRDSPSLPSIRQSATNEFMTDMDTIGHTCPRDIEGRISSWLPIISWIEGLASGCVPSTSIDDSNDASNVIDPSANHPLRNGSVWLAFLVAALSRGHTPLLSSYHSSARQQLFELLEYIFAIMSARISSSSWETTDGILRQTLVVGDPDDAYHPWVNQYPAEWRFSLTLFSRQEWQVIQDMYNKYSRRAPAPWERIQLQLSQMRHLPASSGLLNTRWDKPVAAGDAYDVGTVLSSILWLAADYRFSKHFFDPQTTSHYLIGLWIAGCGWIERLFPNLPKRSSENSLARLVRFMDNRRYHICTEIFDERLQEMYGGVVCFLSHMTGDDVAAFHDVLSSSKPFSEMTYLPEFILMPSKCTVCLWTKVGPQHVLSLDLGDEVCPKISALHVRMEHATSMDDIMKALRAGLDTGPVLVDCMREALEDRPSIAVDRVVRTWAIVLFLLFQTHAFEKLPKKIPEDIKNLLNICRDHLAETDPSGMPTSSPVEFMDLVQNLLDDSKGYHEILIPRDREPCILSATSRKGLHRLLMRLAKETKSLPESLFVRDVERSSNRAMVGGGGYADIYQGSVQGKVVALKHFRVFEEEDVRRTNELFQREALVWRQLRHPYILPFLGIYAPEAASTPYIVSPWMESGDILKYLRKNTCVAADIHRLLEEISEGLFYLHNENIVHGDLRGNNILIDDEGHVRLADFGLSVLAEATKGAYSESTGAGSTRWLAPELIDDPSRDSYRRTPETDVYAFGCVCLEVCTGKKPFYYLASEWQVAMAVLQGGPGGKPKRPGAGEAVGLSDDLWVLMNRCWEAEPQDRVSWLDLPSRVYSVARQGSAGR
ncbi:hypothetical protein OE88DRAFT_1737617 [Heliocybe sulcata]|uniref:Protein kinase domain-containing protein n=1 Tax=Heliocybe sulcata TaxID=5364 RepID=A0A5C3MYL3_9AGAM|nr:hypothetical protein OE88DRAFT_1737617 [Heliocybe sulcata]